jgi:transcriptional regulator with XRE-family HTH domain
MGKYRESRANNDKKWKREFGEKLKSILKEKHMTQTELGQKAKIGQPNIHYFISGRSMPSVREAIKIALALEVDFEELFGFMDYAAWPVYLD